MNAYCKSKGFIYILVKEKQIKQGSKFITENTELELWTQRNYNLCFDPKTILKNYTGSLDYQSLLCLYDGKEINESNMIDAIQKYNELTKIYKFKHPIPNTRIG